MRRHTIAVFAALSSLFALSSLTMTTPSYGQGPARACVQFTIDGIETGQPFCHTEMLALNISYNNTGGAQVSFTQDGIMIGGPSNAPSETDLLRFLWDPATGEITLADWASSPGVNITFIDVPAGSNDLECSASGGLIHLQWFLAPNFESVFEDAPPGSNGCHFTLDFVEGTPVGGEIFGIDTTTLLVAGVLASTNWIITMAGVTAAGIVGFIVTRRLG